MPSMTGTFKLISSENYDEYLTALGVNTTMREVLCTDPPTTQITNEEDEWTISISTTFKTVEIKFKLGQEFDATTADGRCVRSVITQEGETKLVHVVKHGDNLTLTNITEFTDTDMKITLEAPGGIVSTRIYQKQ